MARGVCLLTNPPKRVGFCMANPQKIPQANIAADMTALVAATKDGLRVCNRIIMQRLESEIPLIPELASHLIAAGGKRMRPMLVLAGFGLAQNARAGANASVSAGAEGKHRGKTGGSVEEAAKLAAAVEFIHSATLLHDDVIDESDMRRNNKTASAIWGNEVSVLVGDFLFARAFELMVEVGNAAVLGRVAATACRITEGEIAQLLMVGKVDASMADYLKVIRAKTAELFAVACASGGLLAGGSEAVVAGLNTYGMELGMAFQIADDALDYGRGEEAMGKQAGDDFREGKITLPVLLAWQRGSVAERRVWQKWPGGDGKVGGKAGDDKQAAFAKALDIIAQHDVIAECIAAAENHAEAAIAALGDLADSPMRQALAAAALFAVHRNR